MTLPDPLEKTLSVQMARDSASSVTPFALHTMQGRLVRPDLDLDRTSALFTLDDESAFSSR